MKYAEMSDQDVNIAVAKIMHPAARVIESKSRPPCATVLGHQNHFIDYCNNPADAWPIIVDNKISTYHSIVKWDCSSIVYDSKYSGGFNVFRFSSRVGDISSNGALRAAMIVFLIMKDADK